MSKSKFKNKSMNLTPKQREALATLLARTKSITVPAPRTA